MRYKIDDNRLTDKDVVQKGKALGEQAQPWSKYSGTVCRSSGESTIDLRCGGILSRPERLSVESTVRGLMDVHGFSLDNGLIAAVLY